VDLIDVAVAAHVSWMTAVARATGGRIWREDGLLAAHQPQPYNEVLIPFPERLDGLDGVVEWSRANGVRTIGCWGRDADAPAPPGFDEGWQPHWMAGSASDSGDPRVGEVTEVPEYDGYGQALLENLPARHFVARVDGRFAGMAWRHEDCVFDMFVPKHFRRQGIGAALVRAASAGETVVLNATAEGELLYRSLGFESLGWGRTWWLKLRA
jgi:GNAT superfamily N-acetyltransferase